VISRNESAFAPMRAWVRSATMTQMPSDQLIVDLAERHSDERVVVLGHAQVAA
jgi:hypothetical protein